MNERGMKLTARAIVAVCIIALSVAPFSAATADDAPEVTAEVVPEVVPDIAEIAEAEVAPVVDASPVPPSSSATSLSPDLNKPEANKPEPIKPESVPEPQPEPEPWDFSPYRILVWVVSDDPSINAETINIPLQNLMNREYSAIWRMDVKDAPLSVESAAQRDMSGLSFEAITASDPVLAIKRDHKDAVRLRVASNVGEMVKQVHATGGMIAEVERRAADLGDATIAGVKDRLARVEGDAIAVKEKWNDPATEGVLVSRGMALTLTKPLAKIIALPISGLVLESVDEYDKIFVVRIETSALPPRIDVIELDTLMRYFGPVASREYTLPSEVPETAARTILDAFAPMVRIESATAKAAKGLVRAGGLILDRNSSALVRYGDVLEPLTRKNDRNDNPIQIGLIDWAYLVVVEDEIASFAATVPGELKVGDQIVSIDGIAISDPHTIVQTMSDLQSDDVDVEIDRDGKPQTLKLKKDELLGLRPQYLGFSGRERTIQGDKQLVVVDAPEGSSSDGILRSGDIVRSVGTIKKPTILSLSRSITSASEGESLEVTFESENETKTETIVPTSISTMKGRYPSMAQMNFFAGRAGGLAGRPNKRIFRIALRARRFGESTTLRLHAQREPDFPLIGYEIYDKHMGTGEMTFVGRTDWNGRLEVEKQGSPLHLLYVKNGGAILARLPLVPGLNEHAVADLSGDDMRLEAEAYIRGVQNAITDLVAIRELLAARIRLRLRKGDMKEAAELQFALHEQPNRDRLSDDMEKKLTMYMNSPGAKNPSQRSKIDAMFNQTREFLAKQITSDKIREVDADVILAKKNGGKLPPEPEDEKKKDKAQAVDPNQEPAPEQPTEPAKVETASDS